MRSSVAVTDFGMVTVVDVFFGFAEPFLLDLFDFGMSRDTKGTCIRAFPYPLRNGYFRCFPVSKLAGFNLERKLGSLRYSLDFYYVWAPSRWAPVTQPRICQTKLVNSTGKLNLLDGL